jgi:hypothetical protein
VYTATAPAVVWLCEALDDGRIDGDRVVPFLADALRSAAAVPDDLSAYSDVPDDWRAELEAALTAALENEEWDEEAGNELLSIALQDLRDAAPRAALTARLLIARGQHVVDALDLLAQTRADGAADDIRPWAGPEHPPRVRLIALLSLSDVGADTSDWLGDDDLGVRVVAALRSDHPDAYHVLRSAALDPPALWAAIDPPPAQLDVWGRFAVVERLCHLAPDFDALLEPALACVPHATPHTINSDWGIYLRAAARLQPGPVTGAKRTFVAALVRRRDLWDPRNGNTRLLFKDAVLPYDRKACAKLAGVRLLPWR